MDISALRRRLNLSPHEALSFGAPDTTGWMNVEVTETITGDYKVVGQLRGTAFRPMGASAASMNFAHRRGRDDRDGAEEGVTDTESLAYAWLTFVVFPPFVVGFGGGLALLAHVHVVRSIVWLVASALWLVGFGWHYFAHVDAAVATPSPAPLQRAP
jgi:hypothetical protein